MARFGLLVPGLVLVVAACTSTPAQVSPASSASPVPTPFLSPTNLQAQTPLVGKWQLDRTCAALVEALTKANRPELIPLDITELLNGVPENGPLPSSWDPAHPCANAKPPTKHAHTFWPNGQFNSYDENENQVDNGPWSLVDDHTVKIGDAGALFTFTIAGDSLSLDPVIPPGCSSDCTDQLSWPFAVAYPGQKWTRVTSGPHVP